MSRFILIPLGTLIAVSAANAGGAPSSPDSMRSTRSAVSRVVAAPAQAVIEHYVEATGGRAAFDRNRALRVRGRLKSSGMTGTFDQRTMRPDRMVSTTRLGSLKIRIGYDGESGWETDLASRKVTILDGKDLEYLRSQAWFENEMWAESGGGGGTIRLGSSSYRLGDRIQGLEIAPPVGPSRTLWFNERTGLMERYVVRRDNHEYTMYVLGWRQSGARRYPTVQTSSPPDAEGEERRSKDSEEVKWEERIQTDSLWTGKSFPDSIFSEALDRGLVSWQPARDSLTLPFRYGTRHVWIKASINGAPPADFLLDTGCSITAIDREYAYSIGLASEGNLSLQGVSGSDEGAFARIQSLRVSGSSGSVAVRDLKVALLDLGEGFEAVMWRKAAGLIGYDFLGRFVLEVDYDRNVVTLRDPRTFRYKGKTRPIPMRLYGGIPTIDVSTGSPQNSTGPAGESCTGEFIVDTGNSFGLDIHGSMVRRCQILNDVQDRKQIEVYAGGIGGGAINWFTRLDHVQIGEHELAEPVTGLSLGAFGLHGSHEISGNVGNGVLERFKLIVDYERRQLYLEPGRRFAERDRFTRCGAVFVKLSHAVYPGQIFKGSAAHEAGLKLRDSIQSIDGRPATSFTPEELDRMFIYGEEGSTHTLVIERRGERRTLTVKLRDVL
jgi:hypothetical protein